MRNRRLAILGGVAIAALMLALTPDPAAARGGFGGGGFHGGGFHGGEEVSEADLGAAASREAAPWLLVAFAAAV
jgi:hypothetical protein